MTNPYELLACLVCGTMVVCLVAAAITKHWRWSARWRHATSFAAAYSWVTGGLVIITTTLVVGPSLLLVPVIGFGVVCTAMGLEMLKTTMRRIRLEALRVPNKNAQPAH